MKTISATKARAGLYRLIDEVSDSREPVQITGPRSDVVLISAEDWRAIQETLYLKSIPGMEEKLLKGMATPIEECSDDPGW